MVFKLVRTDTVEPRKIELPVGTHLLGRGKFIQCDDKRISRNHGEIQVTEDAVTIKALHQNPCFYMKKGSDDVEMIRHNCTAELNNGDKFGLLPDSYWYEILHCVLTDINRSPERETVNKNEENDVNNEIYYENTEPMETVCSNSKVDETKKEDGADITGSDNKNSQEPVNFDLNETGSNEDRSDSPSLLQSQQLDENQTKSPEEQVLSPLKRCNSSESLNDDVKKVKVEPDIEQNNIKQEPDDNDAKPGPSNDQGPSNSDVKGDDGSSSPQQPKRILRERCIYGANCYRRNPQHKAEFSHPADRDWGTGDRGECPWGRACQKRDPRHWAQHDHPPGTQPPRPRLPHGPGEKKRKTGPTVASVDDNLPAKRTRKPIKKLDWDGLDLDDDEDEEDPYKTDSSDEWQPGTEDVIESQSQEYDLPDVATQDLSDE